MKLIDEKKIKLHEKTVVINLNKIRNEAITLNYLLQGHQITSYLPLLNIYRFRIFGFLK